MISKNDSSSNATTGIHSDTWIGAVIFGFVLELMRGPGDRVAVFEEDWRLDLYCTNCFCSRPHCFDIAIITNHNSKT